MTRLDQNRGLSALATKTVSHLIPIKTLQSHFILLLMESLLDL